MAQLMPLQLTVSCFSKIQTGFTFLVPAQLGSPGKRAVKRVCVWHELQKWKYIMYRNGTRDNQTTATDNMLRKSGEVWTCGSWTMQADTQTTDYRQRQSTKGFSSSSACAHTHTHVQNGPLSGTTRVGRYRKKYSPTHTHPDHRTSFIAFLHLQRSIASSVFS